MLSSQQMSVLFSLREENNKAIKNIDIFQVLLFQDLNEADRLRLNSLKEADVRGLLSNLIKEHQLINFECHTSFSPIQAQIAELISTLINIIDSNFIEFDISASYNHIIALEEELVRLDTQEAEIIVNRVRYEALKMRLGAISDSIIDESTKFIETQQKLNLVEAEVIEIQSKLDKFNGELEIFLNFNGVEGLTQIFELIERHRAEYLSQIDTLNQDVVDLNATIERMQHDQIQLEQEREDIQTELDTVAQGLGYINTLLEDGQSPTVTERLSSISSSLNAEQNEVAIQAELVVADPADSSLEPSRSSLIESSLGTVVMPEGGAPVVEASSSTASSSNDIHIISYSASLPLSVSLSGEDFPPSHGSSSP